MASLAPRFPRVLAWKIRGGTMRRPVLFFLLLAAIAACAQAPQPAPRRATPAPLPTANRTNLADTYAKVLIASREATRRGLENDPDAQEVLRFQRMQTLAQLLVRKLQRETQNVPPAELEQYYKQQAPQFEEATLR